MKNISYAPCFENLEDLCRRSQTDLRMEFYRSTNKISSTCLILIHGYNSKNKKTYSNLAKRFAARGIDSLVYILPFHFERSVDENILKDPRFIHVFEIYRQSIIELRNLVTYLKGKGYQKVGVLGFSFGGYCCSLLACLEKNTDFIIPMASLGDLGPIEKYLKRTLSLDDGDLPSYEQQLNRTLAENYLHLISPISFNPVIPKQNMLFIQGFLDGRTPVKDVQKFRRKWNWPRVIWYPCDHFTFILFNRLTVYIATNFIKNQNN